ncbi:MAG: heme lyase NrfEFG subunit NrfE, partial [Congregibacter sp.]|nr:heme lyase NrfEFG subunit NrfE [Congregibacter sp.]
VVLACGAALPWLSGQAFNVWVALAIVMAGWLVAGLVQDFRERTQNSPGLWRSLRRQTPSYWGMVLAHCGFALAIIGVIATSQYSIERDLRMAPGDTETLAGYRFEFVETVRLRGANYLADGARFKVYEGERLINTMLAEKRRYLASGSVMTEAAIDGGLFRDLYIAMGEPVGDGGAWAIRLHYKPMVRWMWLGAIFMGAGGLLTVTDRRYRRSVRQRSAQPGDANVVQA